MQLCSKLLCHVHRCRKWLIKPVSLGRSCLCGGSSKPSVFNQMLKRASVPNWHFWDKTQDVHVLNDLWLLLVSRVRVCISFFTVIARTGFIVFSFKFLHIFWYFLVFYHCHSLFFLPFLLFVPLTASTDVISLTTIVLLTKMCMALNTGCFKLYK